MPKEGLWNVINEFDQDRITKNTENPYKKHIPPRATSILSTFRIGDEISTTTILAQQKNISSGKGIISMTSIRLSIRLAAKINLIQKKPKDQNIIEYEEFILIPEIDYWRKQLNDTNLKNIKNNKKRGTRGHYTYKLLRFHNWLKGKTYKIKQLVKTGENSFELKIENIKFSGVIHMLKLVEEENANNKVFVKIIKEFLLDSIHEKNGTGSNILHAAAIKSFFSIHDTDLTFKFNSKALYKKNDIDEEDKPLFTLSKFYDLLTIGKPSLVEKAIYVCKFQRGLDGITFADRFNFVVFKKLATAFGSTDHNSWDLSKCPIIVEHIRIKRGYLHRGVLDIDGVSLIQKYLDFRKTKTGKSMTIGEPLFLNQHNHPITSRWIEEHFAKLLGNIGLKNIGAHEVRDLLKSTLIECGCRADIADHVIGHHPKDSYEKQTKLYPETIRKEYSKGSKLINIFSKFTSVVNGTDDSDELKLQLKEKIFEVNNILEKRLDDEAERIRNGKFAMEQQRQMKKVLQEMENMKSEMKEMKSITKIKSEDKLEFCCISCELVHDKKSCPDCGSKQRKIYDGIVTP